MRILLPGMPCPEWLERIEFDNPGEAARHRVAALSVVTVRGHGADRYYLWRPVFPAQHVLVVDPDGGGGRIEGQSPEGGSGGVVIDVAAPLIGWPVLTIVAALCGHLLGRI